MASLKLTPQPVDARVAPASVSMCPVDPERIILCYMALPASAQAPENAQWF